MKEIDKIVGFGSVKRDKFVDCGRARKTHSSGEISVSMASHIHILTKVDISREGAQHLDDLLMPLRVTSSVCERIAAMGHERVAVYNPIRSENVAVKVKVVFGMCSKPKILLTTSNNCNSSSSNLCTGLASLWLSWSVRCKSWWRRHVW